VKREVKLRQSVKSWSENGGEWLKDE